MPHRLCSRCHADLDTEENGELTYCSHCGAAQITLSEELREQFEQQQLAGRQTADGIGPDVRPLEAFDEPGDALSINSTTAIWPRALRLVAIAAALFTAALLLTAVLPPVMLLALLWMLGAPIVLLGIYSAKNPAERVTTRFGARLGLLSGLSLGIIFITANMLTMFTQRFLLHQGASLDSQFAASLAQMATRFAQLDPSDPTAIQQYMRMFTRPEFHAGMTLLGCAIFIIIYCLYSAIAGAFSGLLRSRAAIR